MILIIRKTKLAVVYVTRVVELFYAVLVLNKQYRFIGLLANSYYLIIIFTIIRDRRTERTRKIIVSINLW